MKACKKCGKAKALQEFSKTKRSKDGLQNRCKPCASADHAEWYSRNKEKNKQANYARKAKNPQAIAEYQAQYRKQNSNKIREQQDAWNKANADKRRVIVSRSVAKREQRDIGFAVQADIDAVYASAARVQQCLGIDMHVDHIIPKCGERVSGLHIASNLQVIPAKENLSKNNRFDPNTHEEPIWHHS